MALSYSKKVFVLLRGITSNHVEDFYCLNFFHLYSTKKHKKHYNACKYHDYCYIEMSKKESILKYNHGQKYIKVPFIIYADLESLLKK